MTSRENELDNNDFSMTWRIMTFKEKDFVQSKTRPDQAWVTPFESLNHSESLRIIQREWPQTPNHERDNAQIIAPATRCNPSANTDV